MQHEPVTSPASPRRIRRSAPASALAIIAVLLSACVHVAPPPPPESPDKPGTPGGPLGEAAVESLRAYLRTFRLDERTLAPGLTIPFEHASGDFECNLGALKATGKIGPQGHQIYEIVNIYRTDDTRSTSIRREYLEISPEPGPAPPAVPPQGAPLHLRAP